jgi:hypothetical protein
LKVLIVSLEELVLRRIWGSELLRATLCKGLRDSVELAGVGEFFTCSKVSSTTSGACLAVLCLSSSRSSFKAVFIVSSISYRKIIREKEWVDKSYQCIETPTFYFKQASKEHEDFNLLWT